VNDQELAGLLEEGVQAAHDDHVEVEEEGGAAQAVQVLLEGGQLLPGAVALAGASCRFSGGMGRQVTSG
jgi:hypothetical protein